MESRDQEPRGRRRPGAAFSRLPTGAKVFLLLSGALLPLALIAFFASLQTTRTADVEARARLRVAVVESSRALAIELIGDMTALRVALNALDADPRNAPSCARVQGVFAQQFAAGARFAVVDRSGRLLCGAPLAVSAPVPTVPNEVAALLIPDQGLVLAMTGESGHASATAFFPTSFLSTVGRPSGFIPAYGADLMLGGERLPLQRLAVSGPLDRTESMRAPLNVAGLALEMTIRSAPITSPLLIAMLLPFLMWAAAAGIGWFVVDRLLIRPLRRLRARVGAYVPGEVIDPVAQGALPAQELRELGDTFHDISRTVQLHEADLAEGLIRQTRLTREVHHRVKNNLQVISSLINFHARGAPSAEANEAYASIQRRVDALAVVHRHHYAELEENRGLELRSVIGELASNIRATAPEHASRLGITLEVEPYLVSQDVAVAVSFLLTEIIELAMNCNPAAQLRVTVRPLDGSDPMAMLRVSSPDLVEGDCLSELIESRYGRVMQGLARQLRSGLHHDPLTGVYEIPVAVMGKA